MHQLITLYRYIDHLDQRWLLSGGEVNFYTPASATGSSSLESPAAVPLWTHESHDVNQLFIQVHVVLKRKLMLRGDPPQAESTGPLLVHLQRHAAVSMTLNIHVFTLKDRVSAVLSITLFTLRSEENTESDFRPVGLLLCFRGGSRRSPSDRIGPHVIPASLFQAHPDLQRNTEYFKTQTPSYSFRVFGDLSHFQRLR